MNTLTVLNGHQSGVSQPLEANKNHLVGADPEDDFILRDAGQARVMLRIEAQTATLTALAGSVMLAGKALAQGVSRSQPLPVALQLQELQLQISQAIPAEVPVPPQAIVPTEQAPAPVPQAAPAPRATPAGHARTRRSRGLGALVCVVAVCAGLSFYLDNAAKAYEHARESRLAATRADLSARWADRPGVQLQWGAVSPQGRIKLQGFVADKPTEHLLRSDIQKSGLQVDVSLVNLHVLAADLQGEFQRGGLQLAITHDAKGRFTLRTDSSQWAQLKKKVANMGALREGLDELQVLFSDAWVRSSGEPLVLRFDRTGPMDAMSRQAVLDLDSINLPEPTRRSIAMVQLDPMPALVTHKKERIMAGAVLSNGVELVAVDKGWVTMARHGMVRRQRLI